MQDFWFTSSQQANRKKCKCINIFFELQAIENEKKSNYRVLWLTEKELKGELLFIELQDIEDTENIQTI